MIDSNVFLKYPDILHEQYLHVLFTAKELFSQHSTKFDLSLELPVSFNWPPTEKWFSTIFQALRKIANVRYNRSVPQIYDGVVMIRVSKNNKKGLIAFDFSDYPERINKNALSDSILYFKMQYLKNGYSDPKIIPGQYIPGDLALYWNLTKLRSFKHQKQYKHEIYGRFGASFATEIRSKAINILKSQNRFTFTGDLKLIRYSKYLKEISQSKICIDLPGNGPICFRLIEYLAIGSCIIGPPHETIFSPPLIDGVHIKYCKPDLSDLVDLCIYYLNNENERNNLARGARNYFDSYLNKDKLAEYYLTNINNLL